MKFHGMAAMAMVKSVLIELLFDHLRHHQLEGGTGHRVAVGARGG